MLGGHGAEVALARPAAGRGQAHRQAQHGDGRQRAGLLGEVLPLLGRRAAPRADGGRPLPPQRAKRRSSTATRTRSASSPVLGSTFDGSYEPVADICAALDQLQADTGLDVPVHVDGASGGFIAPFLDPDLVWDFRLPRVQSINASGHKYGLVYPGVGWVIWRNPDALPDDLVFNVNYLGGDMPTFALNFSRPGQPGRRAVLQLPAPRLRGLPAGAAGVARRRALPRRLDRRDGPLRAHHRRQRAPGVRVHARSRASRTTRCSTSRERLRDRGWLVPAYTFPENRQDLAALRDRRAQRLVARPRRPADRRHASVTSRSATR